MASFKWGFPKDRDPVTAVPHFTRAGGNAKKSTLGLIAALARAADLSGPAKQKKEKRLGRPIETKATGTRQY